MIEGVTIRISYENGSIEFFRDKELLFSISINPLLGEKDIYSPKVAIKLTEMIEEYEKVL